MAGDRRLRKVVEWRERLARFARAGTSIVQFCEDEGISPPAFYSWRKRLGNGATPLQADESAGLGQQHSLFAPVRLTGTAQGGSQVTVWLRGGTRLEIPLADPSVAGTVLGVILHADAASAGGRPC
jgi:transposase-like protein